MDEKRRAELLVVRLRWLALLAGAFMLDSLTPHAVLVVAAIFLYNGIASQISSDKVLFSRHGRILVPISRLLDLVAISLAVRWGGSGAESLYLLYLFVIVGTGYSYNGLLPIVIALLASLTVDSTFICMEPKLTACKTTVITQHAAAYLASALIASYIIAVRRQDESMRLKERKLSALFECGTRITSAHDLHQLLNHVLDTAISETEAIGGMVCLLDTNHQLTPKVIRNADGSSEAEEMEKEIANDVLATGRPILVNPGTGDDTYDLHENLHGPVICVPLVDRSAREDTDRHDVTSRIIGTLSVCGTRHAHHFGQEDLDLLRTLAIHASMGVVNARLYRELHHTFVRTLQSLARSLEARDSYTQGHSYRVSEIAQLVAKQLGLSSEAVEALRNAALLHDIGKIGVPDSVLQKPGRLTPEERLIIQTHSATGENICRPLGLTEDVLFLIRHHQERLNGSGYPDQLKADQHPLPLRILCAVDAFDAMSSDRPYRKALSSEERIEQLNKAAGTEFDPVVVEVLKTMLLSGQLDRFYKKSEDDDDSLRAA